MKRVVLEVRSLEDTLAEAANRMKRGEADETARIGFATPELLWDVLNARRWRLLKALCGTGPISVREAARRIGGDARDVAADMRALVRAGLLEGDPAETIEFPYDAVKVEFMLHAA